MEENSEERRERTTKASKEKSEIAIEEVVIAKRQQFS